MCVPKAPKYTRIRRPFDICVIYDECDSENVKDLLKMMEFKRADGSNIRIFPKDHTAKLEDDPVGTSIEALDSCCAILLVLSDECTNKFLDENGRNHYYFTLIEKACDKEKNNTARILPLFMSRRIVYEGIEGLVKFSNWSYKYKNEYVRGFIEHIGSLQGLFVDPSDWYSKWEKVHSFWEETHDNLVPITPWNFGSEVDFPKIRRLLGGGILGITCGLCCACYPAKTRCWHECRIGIFMGNMACYLVGAIIMFALGFYINCKEEPTKYTNMAGGGDGAYAVTPTSSDISSSEDDSCSTTQSALFIAGSILGIIGFAMGIIVYMFAQKKVRDTLPPHLQELQGVTNV